MCLPLSVCSSSLGLLSASQWQLCFCSFFSLEFSQISLFFHLKLFNSSSVLGSQLNYCLLKEALPDVSFPYPPPLNQIKYLCYIHFHSSLYFSFIALLTVYIYIVYDCLSVTLDSEFFEGRISHWLLIIYLQSLTLSYTQRNAREIIC